MGMGIKLNTELAREAGLDTRKADNAIIVDENLCTSDTHICAAGEIAAGPDATFNRWLRTGRAMADDEKAYMALSYFFLAF